MADSDADSSEVIIISVWPDPRGDPDMFGLDIYMNKDEPIPVKSGSLLGRKYATEHPDLIPVAVVYAYGHLGIDGTAKRFGRKMFQYDPLYRLKNAGQLPESNELHSLWKIGFTSKDTILGGLDLLIDEIKHTYATKKAIWNSTPVT